MCVVILVSACNPSSQPMKTNVVLILTDDQGYGDVGFNGNALIETPTLDQFAEQNIILDNFYVSPVCAPTRASLLSGKYHLRTGTHGVSGGKENMSPDVYTMAELFADNGYHTGAFGKWHNGAHYPFHPNRQGFHQFVGFCMGHWNNYFNSTIEENDEPIIAEGYLPDYLTQRAIDFIEDHHSEPFFCYIPFNTPHSPFQVPDHYFEKYKQKGIDDKAASVYGMVENIDHNVCRILHCLDSLDLDEQTIVIYMSDNGPVPGRFNAHLLGTKGQVNEGSIRVPCVLKLPKHLVHVKHQVITEPTAHIDVFPTLLDLLNLKRPQNLHLDGLSLRNIIEGKADEKFQHRLLFTKASHNTLDPWNASIRSRDYRLVIESDDTLLYNITTDPTQHQNVILQSQDLAQDLLQAYGQWYRDVMGHMPQYTSIPVGVEHQRRILLPAHEAEKTGSISFKEGNGWANDWLLNFDSNRDSIFWKIDVKAMGTYRLELQYDASERWGDFSLDVSTNCSSKTEMINQFYQGTMIESPDRIVRKEVYEKQWGSFDLGNIDLYTRDQYIALRLGDSVRNDLQIKGLILHRID